MNGRTIKTQSLISNGRTLHQEGNDIQSTNTPRLSNSTMNQENEGGEEDSINSEERTWELEIIGAIDEENKNKILVEVAHKNKKRTIVDIGGASNQGGRGGCRHDP